MMQSQTGDEMVTDGLQSEMGVGNPEWLEHRAQHLRVCSISISLVSWGSLPLY